MIDSNINTKAYHVRVYKLTKKRLAIIIGQNRRKLKGRYFWRKNYFMRQEIEHNSLLCYYCYKELRLRDTLVSNTSSSNSKHYHLHCAQKINLLIDELGTENKFIRSDRMGLGI
jgi:hypothetical protein